MREGLRDMLPNKFNRIADFVLRMCRSRVREGLKEMLQADVIFFQADVIFFRKRARVFQRGDSSTDEHSQISRRKRFFFFAH